MTNEIIKQLAKEMEVSEADVLGFARSIANSIEQDKAAEFFVNADGHAQCDMVNAYATHAVRKINEFYTSYITNSEVSSLFNDMVYAAAKGLEIKK